MTSRYTLTATATGKTLCQLHATGCAHIKRTHASLELEAETLEGAIEEIIRDEFEDGFRGGREEIKVVGCAKARAREES